MLWAYDMELVNKVLGPDRDSTSYVLWRKLEIWVRFARRGECKFPFWVASDSS